MKDLSGGLFVWYTMLNHYHCFRDKLTHMPKVLKIVTLIAVSFVAAFILIVVTLFMTSKMILVDGRLYVLDESYSHPDESVIRSGCLAMSPECGVCAGTSGAVLRGDKCYVAE
jgi:hypothetical protein